MNRDRIAGNCKQIAGKVQQAWGRLTHDYKAIESGSGKQLVGRIQERYGISKEEAAQWADEMADALDHYNLDYYNPNHFSGPQVAIKPPKEK